MSQQINFTKRTLQDIQPPTGKRREIYYDTKVKSLCLFVTDKGSKTFYLYRRAKGKPEQIRLGSFPDLSVDTARKKAAEMSGYIAMGKNPQEEIRKTKGELTLGLLFKEFHNRHLLPYRKPKTIAEYHRQFNKHLVRWKNRRLSQISRVDIQGLHSLLGKKHGHYIANRVLALLSVLYSKAKTYGHWEGDNPAQGIERFKEKSRERFLQPDEIPRFFQALAEEENTGIRDCLILCLLTGARRGNVQAMRWQDVNLERREWRILDSKNHEDLLIPLVPKAVEILQARQEAAGEDKWVFPGPGKTGHLVELKTAWARILDRAEIKDLRMHDLRRSLGSWMAIKGASLQIIGKGLGHKSTSTTAIYSRLNLDPVREAMEEGTSAILELEFPVGKIK